MDHKIYEIPVLKAFNFFVITRNEIIYTYAVNITLAVR